MALLGMATLMLLSSCIFMKPSYSGERVSLTQYPYNGDETPRVIVTFCPAFALPPPPQISPGTKVELLADARPYRDDGGVWSDEAMKYDLDTMQAAGIQGVLLMIRPSDLIDAAHIERIRQFFALAAARRPVFSIGLYIFSDSPIDMGSGNVAQFLSQNGFAALPSGLSVVKSKSMLVVFDVRKIRLHRQNYQEERQFDIHTWDGKEKFIADSSIAMLRAADNGQVVLATNIAQHYWPIPRGDGSFLANSLRRAFFLKSPVICIHSWNWFNDGSFICPNTLDFSLLNTVLREEMDALEELRLKKATDNVN